MGLFDTFRRGRPARGFGGDEAEDLRYLQQWVAEHGGVEAFVEPRTTVTEVTVVVGCCRRGMDPASRRG